MKDAFFRWLAAVWSRDRQSNEGVENAKQVRSGVLQLATLRHFASVPALVHEAKASSLKLCALLLSLAEYFANM